MSETIDLKDLKELAEAAKTVSDGEWEHTEDRHGIQDVGDDYDRVCVFGFLNEEDHQWLPYGDAETNAAFIAAANPKTVLELIARVEAAERSLNFASGACEMSVETIATLSTALEQAKAREAELLGALEPFAKLADFWLERASIHGLDDEDTCATEIEFGHLRNAVSAMGGDDNG